MCKPRKQRSSALAKIVALASLQPCRCATRTSRRSTQPYELGHRSDTRTVDAGDKHLHRKSVHLRVTWLTRGCGWQALCDQDKQMISALAKDFELDFVSLSFTREAADVEAARQFLQSIGLGSTKVCSAPRRQ